MVNDRHTAKGLQQIVVGHATEEVGCAYRCVEGALVASIFLCLLEEDVVLADVVIVVLPVVIALRCGTTTVGSEARDVGTAVPLVVVPTAHQVNKAVGSLLKLGRILERDGFGSVR